MEEFKTSRREIWGKTTKLCAFPECRSYGNKQKWGGGGVSSLEFCLRNKALVFKIVPKYFNQQF